MVKGVVKPQSESQNQTAIIANSYRQVTKRFTPCRVFSSAVSIAYYQELVKRLLSTLKICIAEVKENARRKKPEVIFEKVLDFLSLLWYVVVLTEKEAQPMKSRINELWHGNIVPQEDSRTNSPEMKELLGYMARHHEDLEKSFTDEQKETFEKFHDCWSEYMSLAEAAIFEYTVR